MDIGALRHLVTLEHPGAAVPDGDGGFTQTWTALSPSPVYASITPASARDLERVAAGTVLSTASHVVKMRYHPQVTTHTRMLFQGRVFSVTGVTNPDERNIETICLCAELLNVPLVTADASWMQAGWAQ